MMKHADVSKKNSTETYLLINLLNLINLPSLVQNRCFLNLRVRNLQV